MKKIMLTTTFLLFLAACSSGGGSGGSSYHSGTLKAPAKSYVKLGKPYRVKGVTYRPAHQPDYDEVGVASWYGPGFHGRSTATGETYDKWAMTAAHTTLPMPSLVEVTHLGSGKKVVVRVNDRGPFAHGRIIDLSRAAAEELDMIGTGVAKVRVRYLEEETDRLLAQVEAGRRPFEVDIEREILSPTRLARAERSVAAPSTVASNSEANPVPPVRDFSVQSKHTSQAPTRVSTIWDRLSIVSNAHAEELHPPQVIRSSELPALGGKVAQPKPSVIVGAPSSSAKSVYDVLPEKELEALQNIAPAAGGNPQAILPYAGRSAAEAQAYFVKLATFSDAQRAQSIANKLGENIVVVEPTDIQGRKLYRVTAGPFVSKAEADRTVSQAFRLGLRDAYVSEK